VRKKEKKGSHSGTANTALLEEGEKRFERCRGCVAVRKKEKKGSHSGTANTALLEEGEKRFERCRGCVAVREKEEGVSRRHGEHGGGRKV